MSVSELSEELEATIAAHDLSEEHAARVRELTQEGVPILDAIKQAGETPESAPPPAVAIADPASGLGEPSDSMLKRLGAAVAKHEKAVRTIMGGFVDGFTTCHICDGLGLEQPGPKPRSHDFFAACGTCCGYGQVLTGSLVEGKNGVDCPDCGGRGYLEAMMDNTTAVEIVQQVREQRRLAAFPAPPPVYETSGEGSAPEISMGRPAWMGDTSLGQ